MKGCPKLKKTPWGTWVYRSLPSHQILWPRQGQDLVASLSSVVFLVSSLTIEPLDSLYTCLCAGVGGGWMSTSVALHLVSLRQSLPPNWDCKCCWLLPRFLLYAAMMPLQTLLPTLIFWYKATFHRCGGNIIFLPKWRGLWGLFPIWFCFGFSFLSPFLSFTLSSFSSSSSSSPLPSSNKIKHKCRRSKLLAQWIINKAKAL